jgi:possible vacuolar-type H+-ATPase subunit H
MEVASKDVFKLIQELEEVIDSSSTGVFSSRKISIEKDFLMEKLNDIKIALPNQFKHADYVYKEKDKILDDAKAEAEDILEKTREYAKQKVSEHEITLIAEENAKRLEEESIAKAEELKEGARSYAVEMLKKVNSNIEKLNNIISNNIKELEEYDL